MLAQTNSTNKGGSQKHTRKFKVIFDMLRIVMYLLVQTNSTDRRDSQKHTREFTIIDKLRRATHMLAQTNNTCKRTIRSIPSVLTAETAVYTADIPESLSYEYVLKRRKKLLNQIVCAEKKKYQVCIARDT